MASVDDFLKDNRGLAQDDSALRSEPEGIKLDVVISGISPQFVKFSHLGTEYTVDRNAVLDIEKREDPSGSTKAATVTLNRDASLQATYALSARELTSGRPFSMARPSPVPFRRSGQVPGRPPGESPRATPRPRSPSSPPPSAREGTRRSRSCIRRSTRRSPPATPNQAARSTTRSPTTNGPTTDPGQGLRSRTADHTVNTAVIVAHRDDVHAHAVRTAAVRLGGDAHVLDIQEFTTAYDLHTVIGTETSSLEIRSRGTQGRLSCGTSGARHWSGR